MQFAIEQRLSSLVDPTNNYKNLTNAWQNSIPFGGKTYTVGDLASSNFPGLGDKYNALQKAARREFHKGMWNLAIMKTCTWYTNPYLQTFLPKGNTSTYVAVSNWAQENLYNTYPGVFLRYSYDESDGQNNLFTFCYWNLGIGGNQFPPAACNQLFQDDTPGHIINPDGLFPRRYVFEQFHTVKPDFGDWRDLSDGERGPAFTFTGGMFPEETVKSKVEVLPLPKEKGTAAV